MTTAPLHRSPLTLVAAAGHLGVWPALYAGAALTCFARLAGIWQPSVTFALATASVVLTALGTYLIDRVKLADHLLDPADAEAQPRRYAFLTAHARSARALAAGALLTGAACGIGVSRWAPLATVASAAGVALYAFQPRRKWPRPKDLLWLKNAYVAFGLMAFTALAALAAASPTDSPAEWYRLATRHRIAVAGAAVFVTVRVMLDAALCDIDDEPTDRRFGTATAATAVGGHTVRRVATALGLGLCAALFVVPAISFPTRLRWIGAGMAGIAALRFLKPAHLRDFIDVRFPLEAAACLFASFVL